MDNNTEQLSIDKDRIIYILLKQLMYLKNELAYVQNKAGLNNGDGSSAYKETGATSIESSNKKLETGAILRGNSNVELKNDINTSDGSSDKLGIGINTSDGRSDKLGIGIITSDGSHTKKEIGIITSDGCHTKKEIGIITSDGCHTKKEIGINTSDGCHTKTEIGINTGDGSIPFREKGIISSDWANDDKNIGINSLVRALSALSGSANSADKLHSFFEQSLIEALEQYIKTGHGQNALYSYYSDFIGAVAEANAAAERLKHAAIVVRLEDTHVLPAEIKIDNYSTSPLESALRSSLPPNTKFEMVMHLAVEILYLHNVGMSKQTPLRELIRMSASGFSKHLPRLITYGLVKELPSKNYGLTEKSTHILLELFGIAKN